MLSSDIITGFRGRGGEIRVYPVSVSEFYAAGRFETWEDAWNQYYTFGGLPYILHLDEEGDKENYLKKLIFSKGISSFTDDLVGEFAQFGSNLTQFVIEYAEDVIFNLEDRKEKFESLEKDDRKIATIFGEIKFKRRKRRIKG